MAVSAAVPRPRTPRRYAAQAVFFPLAAAYAAVAVPLSVYGMMDGTPRFAGLSTPAGHAHEMLFGFAFAVVAGFTINRARAPELALLVSLWVAARGAFVLAPGDTVAVAANAAFAILTAWLAVPQFLRGAKKWRNRAIGPMLLMVSAAVLIFHLADSREMVVLRQLAVHEAVLVLSALMLFMGGRLIAPAAAGAQRLQGHTLEARVQPRLEASLLLLLLVAAMALPLPGGAMLSGIALFAAALIAAVRLARWRLWRCREREDLLFLGLGQAWLALGLAVLGCAWLLGQPPPSTALHTITIAALGTLTITTMARTRRVSLKRSPARLPGIGFALLLIAIAAVLRIGAPHAWQMASGLWSAAYATLLVHLLWLQFARQ